MSRLAYLCLQPTTEGQAAHVHVREIIRGLRTRGWEVDLYNLPDRAGRLGLLSRALALSPGAVPSIAPRLQRRYLVCPHAHSCAALGFSGRSCVAFRWWWK